MLPISIVNAYLNTLEEETTIDSNFINKKIVTYITKLLKQLQQTPYTARLKIYVLSAFTEDIKKLGYLPNNIYYQVNADLGNRYIITGVILPIADEANTETKYIRLQKLLEQVCELSVKKAHICISNKVISSPPSTYKKDLYDNLYLVSINQKYRIFANSKNSKLFSEPIEKVHGTLKVEPVLTFGELLTNITRE